MSEHPKKPFNLEERTFLFAKEARQFVKSLPFSISNSVDAKQLIRSSGSVGANYIEANEALSKKDFSFRIRISRKEAKESAYWLRLIMETNDFSNDRIPERLFNEAIELTKIFSAIAEKSK